MFIAVKICSQEKARNTTYNFISMKTLEVERSLSCRAQYLQYDKGYLFVAFFSLWKWRDCFFFRAQYLQYDKGHLFVSKKENLVRILDVASGTFPRDIRIKPSKNYHMIFRVNSNYVVMNNLDSKLHVYDLKCLRETAAVPSHLLLTTIDLECTVK